jgi:ABC-type glycerol-3-phosphate transport system permease component
MNNFYLQVIATIMCLICAAMANYCALTMDLNGVRLVLVNIVGMGCLPLGMFMAYTAYQERKFLSGN